MRFSRKCIALAAVFVLVFTLSSVSIADAGSFAGGSDWGGDSGWGGGADWGSSSDWGGSSDWGSSDSSSDWDGFGAGWILGSALNDNDDGGNNSGNSGSDLTLYDDNNDGSVKQGCVGDDLFFFVLLAIIAIVALNYFKSRKPNSGANVYQASEEDAGLPLSDLKAKDPDFNEQALLEKVGNQYVQMQQAWQSKDWEPMRAIMTDSLFNQMNRQLSALKQQGLTNYVERIAVLDARIRRYAVEGDNDVLVVRLSTRICDYTVNDKTGDVVSGDKNKELFMTYDWKLTRQKDKKTLAQASMTELNCSNCGAPLSINQSGKCPYCGSVITLSDHDWALSVIKGISQRSAS